MSLTLYVGSKRYSSWSLRGYLALAHSGATFEMRVIVLDRPDSTANMLAVNPAGRVPVLHDGDLVVWDSLAICEYIHELFPAANLWPADRATRARARSICCEMHSSFTGLRNAMPMDLGADKTGQGHTAEALADAQRVMHIWNESLSASGGPFLFGALTFADCMYAPVATRFRTYGVPLDDVSRRYVEAIYALPTFQSWYADAVRS